MQSGNAEGGDAETHPIWQCERVNRLTSVGTFDVPGFVGMYPGAGVRLSMPLLIPV